MNKNILTHFQTNDPILYKTAVQFSNLVLQSNDDHFSKLCESIISQQLSDKAGATIFSRFKKLFKNEIITPSFLSTLSDESIRSAGPSRAKTSYLKGLALKVVNKEIDFAVLKEKTDEEVIAELIKIHGIGRWTAEIFIMFSLGREDVFSYGDLGLRKGIQKLYQLPSEPTKLEAENITQKWSPYRTYGSMILWRL